MLVNTTDFKLIMECQSETPVCLVNNKNIMIKKIEGYSTWQPPHNKRLIDSHRVM